MITIERCHMSRQCGQRWELLEPVLDNPRVRYCDQCQSAVHLVELERELIELARQGKCVAIVREDCIIAAGLQKHA